MVRFVSFRYLVLSIKVSSLSIEINLNYIYNFRFHPALSFETLNAVIDKTEQLQVNFSKTSYFIHLKHFLAQLFATLPENYKVMFIDKYPPLNYPYIWVCLSLKAFSSSHFSELNKLVAKCSEYTEEFSKGKCSLECFKTMVWVWKNVFWNSINLKVLILIWIRTVYLCTESMHSIYYVIVNLTKLNNVCILTFQIWAA